MFDLKLRHLVPVVCLFALAMAAGCGNLQEEETAGTTPNAATTNVTIFDFQLQPQELTVTEGTRVTWTNKDQVQHTVTADTGEFDQLLEPGETWSYTFKKKGTIRYQDRLNVQPGLKGAVIVQ